MKLNQLKHFVAVVDCGSISAASEKLFLSQPNLSRSIKLMEEELGEQLLVRSAQGTETTEFGRQVYYYAKSIQEQVSLLERLKDIREGGSVSSLQTSVYNIYLKDDVLPRFQEQHPATNITIGFHETTAERAINDVVKGISDFALMAINDRQMPVFMKMIESQGLTSRRWDRSNVYVHVHKEHELAGKEVLDIKELADYTYLHLPYDFFSNFNVLMHEEHIAQWISHRTITMSNYHAMLRMLRCTSSYMVGHKWQIEELSNFSVESIPLENATAFQNFVFLAKKGGTGCMLPETAIEFLQQLQDIYQFPDFSI